MVDKFIIIIIMKVPESGGPQPLNQFVVQFLAIIVPSEPSLWLAGTLSEVLDVSLNNN